MRLLDDLLHQPLERRVRVAFTDADDWRTADAAAILARRGIVPMIESRAGEGGGRRLVEAGDADVLLVGHGVPDDLFIDRSAFSLCLVDTLSEATLVCIHGTDITTGTSRARAFLWELAGREVTLQPIDARAGGRSGHGADACLVWCTRDRRTTPLCRLMREFGQAQIYGPFFPDVWPTTAYVDPRASVEEIVGTATLLCRVAALASLTRGETAVW